MSITLKPDSTRIESIDILRGFSLLGIILVHMVEQYYAGPMPEKMFAATSPSIGDQIAQGVVGLLIVGKFYMIFSFLFGLSFYIQFSKSGSDDHFLARFMWRLIVLFIIGVIHSLHYRGDILTIYAVLGLGLLLFYRLPDKVLLWSAVLLILNIPTVAVRTFEVFSAQPNNPFPNLDQSQLQLYYDTLKSGAYVDILKANFYELSGKADFQIFSGRAYITFGLFLLGIYAGRKKFFSDLTEKIRQLKDIRFYAWMGIVFSVVSGLLFFGGTQIFGMKVPESVTFLIGGLLFDLFNASLATIYVMWIILWSQRVSGQKVLMNLYPVGRMGLTTYLMQTLSGTLIYFSYGLGLLNEFGALLAVGLALLLFGVQIIFAKWWFTRFAYGPVEWLWRNLTYFKVYPIVSPSKAIG